MLFIMIPTSARREGVAVQPCVGVGRTISALDRGQRFKFKTVVTGSCTDPTKLNEDYRYSWYRMIYRCWYSLMRTTDIPDAFFSISIYDMKKTLINPVIVSDTATITQFTCFEIQFFSLFTLRKLRKYFRSLNHNRVFNGISQSLFSVTLIVSIEMCNS